MTDPVNQPPHYENGGYDHGSPPTDHKNRLLSGDQVMIVGNDRIHEIVETHRSGGYKVKCTCPEMHIENDAIFGYRRITSKQGSE